MKRCCAMLVPIVLLVTSCIPPHNIQGGGWMFTSGTRKGIVDTAKHYMGVRYKYGGESPSGFDCSGYVMYVYKKNGISLSRATVSQYKEGRKIPMSNARPADLVFFKTMGGRISHVGIYLGKGKFIHAPSTGKKVSVASMNNKYWRRKFAGVVTYL